MTLYRSRYGGTSAPNYDDPSAGQHHWPDSASVVEVGPLTAAHLCTHELFAEVAPHEAPAVAPVAPHATSTAMPGTLTSLPDQEASVPHEQAPADVTERVTEPSPVTAAEDVDDDRESAEKRAATPRRRRRVSE